MKRRIFACVLACLMILTALPVVAFAEDVCPGKNHDHKKDNCTYTLVEVVPSQCGEFGYTLYECNTCGDVFAGDFNKVEGSHDWVAQDDAKDATCTEAGKKESYVCSNPDCSIKTKGGETIPALGHNMVVTSTTGDCMNAGEQTLECTRCDYKVTTPVPATGEGHEWGEHPSLIKVEPTWKDEGIAVYSCVNCDATKEVVINALGHNHQMAVYTEAKAPTCTETGSKASWKCAICEVVYYDEAGTTRVLDEADLVIDALGHDFVGGNVIENVPADCTNAGHKVTQCSRCDETKTETTTALGHDTVGGEVLEYQPADCRSDGYRVIKCGRCGKTVFEEIPSPGHDFEGSITTVAPGCNTVGYDLTKCTRCTYVKKDNFTDPVGHTTWTDTTSYGHSETPMTCESDGLRQWKCGRCDADCNETVEKTGHKEETVTVPATCAAVSYTFTYCTNEHCNKPAIPKYTDNGKDYDVTVGGNAIHFLRLDNIGTDVDPNAHKVVEKIVNAATCTQTGNKLRYCEYCDALDEVYEIIPATGHKASGKWITETDATCTTDGTKYQLCTVCGDKALTGTIDALGHDMVVDTVVAPTCITQGYTTYKCANGCGETSTGNYTDYAAPAIGWFDSKEEAAASHKGLEAVGEAYRQGNCLLCSLEAYYCADCEREILVRADDGTGNGHNFVEIEAEIAATCTANGITAKYECSVCGATKGGETIPTPGHTVVVDPYKAPTCTETGLTEGSHCSVCGDILVAQTVISATGHTYEVVDFRAVDCENYGYTHYACYNCKSEVTKDFVVEYIDGYVAAKVHNYVKNDTLSTAPTCTAAGEDVFVCEKCGDSYTNAVAALGHKNQAGEVIVDACTDTVTDRVCVNCGNEIAKSHTNVIQVDVAATCLDYGYTMDYCTACKWHDVTFVDTSKLGGHTMSAWTVATLPTITSEGKEVRNCTVCGNVPEERVIPALAGVKYTMTVDNANYAGAAITDSSLVAVTVSVAGKEVGVQGLLFDVNYDANIFKFEKAEFVSESFTTLCKANDNGNYVTVSAMTPNDAYGNIQEHVVNAAEAVVVLYFRVDCADGENMTVAGCASDLDFGKTQVVNAKGAISAESVGATVSIVKFLDVNNDGDVNLVDLQIVVKMMTGEVTFDYSAVVDTDKNGVVDGEDVNNLLNYLLGAMSYDAVKNVIA